MWKHLCSPCNEGFRVGSPHEHARRAPWCGCWRFIPLPLASLAHKYSRLATPHCPVASSAASARYYCVRNDVDFLVLAELFDGEADLQTQQDGEWSGTEQPKYKSLPMLKVSRQLLAVSWERVHVGAGPQLGVGLSALVPAEPPAANGSQSTCAVKTRKPCAPATGGNDAHRQHHVQRRRD